MIVDGKLKDGDKVLVECVPYTPYDSVRTVVNSDGNRIHQIKLNPHITIYPVEEKMYTREEVYQIYLTALSNYKMTLDRKHSWDSDKWFEQNVK